VPPANARTESVWEYPRPPRLEPAGRRIRVVHGGVVLADTTSALRILETSHPPVYYLPPAELAWQYLRRSTRRPSFCEFKGLASYWNVEIGGRVVPEAGWSYPHPAAGYAELANHVAFYAGKVEECWVDGERVLPQPGDFYGGWITSQVTGPFKGAPGTLGW
jgi:uncharacterized protein (DUF427 family)